MKNRVIKMYKWKDLEGIHKQIYNDNKRLTPYQSYEFLSVVGLGKNDRNPFDTVGYTENNFVLYDENNYPIALVPLYSKKNGKDKIIYFRGYFTSAGHLDFIYNERFSYEDYIFLMNYIKKFYGRGILVFDRISERSLVYKYASQENKFEMEKSTLVTIQLPSNYDEWYSSLAKSIRQNIRTSYNRIKKDSKELRFDLYYSTRPEKKVREDITRLFARRLCEHSNINSKLVEKTLIFLKRKNPMTLGIINNSAYIGATLYVDNKLAAFFDGLVSNNNSILVPRLSINLDFGRYSPGGILINETMKSIINTNKFTEFDLQRGDEKYKYSYGGIEYYNYEWKYEF